MNYLEKLKEFDSNTKQNIVEYVPGDFNAIKRIRLIQEECNELVDALNSETKENVLKEICDVLYVVFGTASLYNLNVDDAFALVHENNMLKINYPKNEFGKIIKSKDHPKVSLTHLL